MAQRTRTETEVYQLQRMRIELENALFTLQHQRERKASAILREAIKTIKALIPEAWQEDE